MPILIADHDQPSRNLMFKLLARARHNVLCATNGRDALQMLQQTSYQVLVTDLDMAFVDGRELCAAVRHDPRLRNLSIMLVTRSLIGDEERAAIGADVYLRKPFGPREFNYTFSNLLLSTCARRARIAEAMSRG